MQYTIEEKIQEGVFTSVYRAYDPVLQRRVLLKVLHKHHAADPDLHQRFMREAQACAALRSEYIVQVYALTDYEDCPAIVMEFVEGTSLKQLISDGSTHTFKYAQTVALHALRGLVAAHERGIVHRDIKPGNILCTNNNIFKITDFGLASLATVPSITSQGMVLGTPAYMSPEQIRHEDIDQRSDLFSLGATLIEVLTGERIFEGTSYSDCAKKILTFHTESLDRLAEQSSVEFVKFLKLLMAPNRIDRFAGSRDALLAFSHKDPDVAMNVPPRSASSTRRYAVLFGSAALFIAVLLLFVPSNIFDARKILPAKAPSILDTSSASPALNTTEKIVKELPLRGTNDPPQTSSHTMSNAGSTSANERIHPAPDSGSVTITSTPWAKIYVDNKYIGETPLSKPLILAAGRHSVLFVHPSFDPIMQTINVLPLREISARGNFLDRIGYLNCLVTPWAEVYIDDHYIDTTPLEKPIMLPPGKYQVRFKNASFQDIVREVMVRSKDTTSISIAFKGQK